MDVQEESVDKAYERHLDERVNAEHNTTIKIVRVPNEPTELRWELLDHSGTSARAKVPGGWIYKISNVLPLVDPRSGEILQHYGFMTESICFVPDVSP